MFHLINLTKEEHVDQVSRYMSKDVLGLHWSEVLYKCSECGMIEREDATDLWNVLRFIEQNKKDIITLVLRLMGSDPNTFSPETLEVMKRWETRAREFLSRGGNYTDKRTGDI